MAEEYLYRLEPMPPQRLVPAAARRLVRAEPSWRVLSSAVSPCGGATLGILGGGDSMAAARRLCTRRRSAEPSGESLQRLYTGGWWQ